MVRSHKIVIIKNDSGEWKLLPKDLLAEKSVSPYDLSTNIDGASQRWGLHYERPVNKKGEAKPLGRTLILVVDPDKEIAKEYKNIFAFHCLYTQHLVLLGA